MSARRSSQPSVQLFPFLAVLMCALGALILMLLVTSARIRDQARAQVAGPLVAQVGVVPDPPGVVRPEAPPRAEWKPLTAPPAAVLHPAPALPAPVLAPPPTESVREQWQRTVNELEAAAAAEEAALRARQTVAEEGEAALQATTTRLAGVQQDADAAAQRRLAAESELQRTKQLAAELRQTISAQQSDVEQLREQLQAVASRYSVLPYDGRTGTVRRPIYIECTETGLTFASERITLTPEQLNGFPSVQNPLRAGADALIDYWSLKGLKDTAADELGAPYVLLIVRPRGTVGYYVARRMLESLGQSYGYELVSEDLELEWPESDAGAVKACQTAIDTVLRNRDRIAYGGGFAAPGGLEPLSVADGQGHFALEEVERLRGNGRTVYFGGRAFDRNGSGSGATPGAPGRFAPGGSRAPVASGNSAPGTPGNFAPGVSGEPVTSGSFSPGASGNSGPGDSRNNAEPGLFPDTTQWGRGATAGSPDGSASTAGSPVDAPGTAASAAAAGFSAAAGRAGRSSGGQAGVLTNSPNQAAPRPLPAFDPLERNNLAPARTPMRNPTEVLRDPSSAIGLERKVIVRVDSQRVAVESEPPITISSGISREGLQSQLAHTLQDLFTSWGRPPRGFYWSPRMKYSVLPGGQQHLKRLTDLTEEWELASEIDFKLE